MSEDYSHVPDWCRPGAMAVEISDRPDSGTRGQQVVRVTKTQVVTISSTGNETRYKVRDGQITRSAGAWWFWTLVARDDPAAVAVLAQARQKRLAAEVEDLALRWRRDGDLDAAAQIAQLLVDAGVIESYVPASLPQENTEGETR